MRFEPLTNVDNGRGEDGRRRTSRAWSLLPAQLGTGQTACLPGVVPRAGASDLVMMVTCLMQKKRVRRPVSDLACVGDVNRRGKQSGKWPSGHPDELMSMQPSFPSMQVGPSKKVCPYIYGFAVCCLLAFWHVRGREQGAGDPSPRRPPGWHHSPGFLVCFSGTEWTALGLSRAWGLRLFPGAKNAAPFLLSGLLSLLVTSLVANMAGKLKDIGLTDCRRAIQEMSTT